MTRNKRISRGKRADVLNDMYGKLYDDRKARINYPKNKNERKLLSTINELYELRVKLGKYKDKKGKMKYKLGLDGNEFHVEQLERVMKLNKTAVMISDILSKETMTQTVLTCDKIKLDEVNEMIDGFNDYMKQNELVKFVYNEMKHIKLPSDIIVYKKERKDNSYQVVIQSSPVLDNTGVGDLEIKLSNDSASITPTVNIHHQPIYNKRIEKHNENIKNKDMWYCKKCGFGHMLFEVI